MDEQTRRRRELKAALEQIRAFQKGQGGSRFQLNIPVWRLALEGLSAFSLAFLSGLGLAIVFQVLFG